MEARMGNNAGSNMNTFEPLSDLIQEEDCNTLLLYIPGFTKEQLRVQLTRARVLKISGSRPIGDNKMSSFHKDFPISENIDTNKITAKFEDGILYIRQPKLIVPAEKHDQNAPPQQPHKPAESTGVSDRPRKNDDPPLAAKPPKTEQQPRPAAPKATPHAQDLTEKSKEKKKEEKPTKKEEKSNDHVTEKTDGVDHGKKVAAGKTDGVDHGKKVAAGKSDGDRREKVSGAKVEDNKNNKNENAAAVMLKMAREKVMKILLFVFAFALGIYVSKLRSGPTQVDN